MIDLHSHSTASDGSLSPAELLSHAKHSGLTALALTDHDTCDGLSEAAEAAARVGIRFIPGIEIEVEWKQGGVFHLLGLGIDRYRQGMSEIIPHIQSLRVARNKGIVAKMNEAGVDTSLDEISAFAGGAIVGRPHFADFLVHRNMVKDRQKAFDLYLGNGKKWYVPYQGIALNEALDAIHASGGKAFVAHPLSLYVSWTRLEELCFEWKTAGVDGIEAYHPSADLKRAQRLEKMAVAAGLRISAGSDFHGDKRPDRVLGKTLEERRSIEDHFLSIFE